GKIYIALPPLYKISKGKGKNEKVVYAWDDDEMEKAIKEFKSGYMVQRYKGLGEMNADQLWETTMNLESRTFIQVELKDAIEADEVFSIVMGDKVEPRRACIEENADNVQNLDV